MCRTQQQPRTTSSKSAATRRLSAAQYASLLSLFTISAAFVSACGVWHDTNMTYRRITTHKPHTYCMPVIGACGVRDTFPAPRTATRRPVLAGASRTRPTRVESHTLHQSLIVWVNPMHPLPDGCKAAILGMVRRMQHVRSASAIGFTSLRHATT